MRAVAARAATFEFACGLDDLCVAAGVLQFEVGECHALPGEDFRRLVGVIDGEKFAAVAEVGNAVLPCAAEAEGQFAFGGGALQGDVAHVGGDEGFAVEGEAAAASAQAGKCGRCFCRCHRTGQHVLVARFGKPAVAAVGKEQVPFVPDARVVARLQAAHQGERLFVKHAAGADLQRAEVFQQRAVFATITQRFAFADEQAVAVAAHQRHRAGAHAAHRRAAAGAVGMEKRRGHVSQSAVSALPPWLFRNPRR